MAAQLGDLSIAVSANIANFINDMKRVEREADQRSRSLQSQFANVGKIVGASLASAATAVGAGVKRAVDQMDALNDTAKQLGVSVTALSELGYAAKMSGTNVETLSTGMKKLTTQMAGAAGGNKELAETFRAIGVNVTDANGQIRAADSVFADIAERFRDYKDGAGEVALASKIFGRAAGPELLQLLNEGKGGIVALREEAKALGVSLGEDAAAQAAQFNDGIDKMRTLLDGMFQQIAVQVLPTLNAFLGILIDSGKEANATASNFSFITTAFKGVAVGAAIVKNAVEAVVNVLAAAGKTIANFIEATAEPMRAWGKAIDANLRDGPIAGIKTLYEESQKVGKNQTQLLNEVKAAWSTAGDGIESAIADVTNAFEAANTPAAALAQSVKETGSNAGTATPPILRAAGAVDEVAEAAKRAADELYEFQQSLSDAWDEGRGAMESIEDLAAQLEGPSVQALRDYNKALEHYRALLDKGAIGAQELQRAEEVLARQRDEDLRRINEAAAEDFARQQAEFARIAEERARQFEAFWGGAIGSVATAFGDFAARGFKDFKGMLSQMKDGLKRWVADVISMLAQRALTNAFSRFLGGAAGGGGGGWLSMLGSALGGGGGGGGGTGWLSSLGSMVGGNGTGGNWLSMLSGNGGGIGGGLGGLSLSQFTGGGLNASAMQSYGVLNTPTGSFQGLGGFGTALAGIGGALYGYNRTNGGLAGVGAAASYGALGIGVAGTAAGLAGGAGIGAAAGGAFSSLGAGAAVPVVGWILAAIAAIDMISGGKLFGTKYRPESSTSTIALGPEGGTATASLTEVRQRSLFRGRQWQTRSIAAGSEAVQAAQDLFRSLEDTIKGSSDRLKAEAPQMFEAAIRTVNEYDKKGKVKSTKIFVDVLGRTFREETGEGAAMRLTAEAILHSLKSSIEQSNIDLSKPILGKIAAIGDGEFGGGGGGRRGGGGIGAVVTHMNEVDTIAERWRRDSALLLDGATMLLEAQAAINEGTSLLGEGGTLTMIADLVEELQRDGESLTQTFSRISASSSLMRDAFERANVDMEVFTEDFVRFSEEFVDAAGGLEAAGAAWQRYFDKFYSAEENLDRLMSGLSESVGGLLEGLGLDSGTSMEEFRALFEERLPTLSAEAIVEWLRAADALATLTDIQAQVTAQLEAQARAAADYARWLEDLNEPATEFEADLRDISRGLVDARAQAEQYAIAAGRAGASQEELAQITNWASRQYAQAVERLRQRVADLAAQLYGTQLDQINLLIEQAESSSASAQAAAEAAQAANQQRYEQELAYLRQIEAFVESLKLSALSPLNPQERFNEAQSTFLEDVAAARAGDLDALARLTQGAQQYLTEAEAFLGRNDQYTSIFEDVMATLESFGVSGGIEQPTTTTTVLLPSPELEELYARRDQLMAEQAARERLLLADQLTTQLGQYAEVMNRSAAEIASTLGFSLTELVADLGINLDEVTTATVQQLASIAGRLDMELTALSSELGLALGEITDTTSLLNDALELEISALPDDIRDQLEPLLRAVEQATEEADANAALGALRSAVDELAPELRNELAPYLGLEIDLVDPIEGVNDSIVLYGQQQVAALAIVNERLSQIATNTAGGSAASVTPPAAATSATVSPAEASAANAELLLKIDRLIDAVNSSSERIGDSYTKAARLFDRERAY